MGMYKEYFKYVMEHKKNVFIECMKQRLYLHAFTHDLSKFRPSEFIPYAKYFYGYHGVKLEKDFKGCDKEVLTNGLSCVSNLYLQCCKNFDNAWEKHYKINKHHWDHWIGKDMPEKYIEQMICDWKGMSRKFGGTAQEFYLNNYNKIILTDKSRVLLENNLGLNSNNKYTLKQQLELNMPEFSINLYCVEKQYKIDLYKLFYNNILCIKK